MRVVIGAFGRELAFPPHFVASQPASPSQPQRASQPANCAAAALCSRPPPSRCSRPPPPAGNPHCASPSALRSQREVEGARAALLRFFGADPAEYELVFTRWVNGRLSH